MQTLFWVAVGQMSKCNFNLWVCGVKFLFPNRSFCEVLEWRILLDKHTISFCVKEKTVTISYVQVKPSNKANIQHPKITTQYTSTALLHFNHYAVVIQLLYSLSVYLIRTTMLLYSNGETTREYFTCKTDKFTWTTLSFVQVNVNKINTQGPYLGEVLWMAIHTHYSYGKYKGWM